MSKQMMIDVRNDDRTFSRFVVDDMEFCVRDGMMYFTSGGNHYSIPLEQCSQVYLA